MPMPADPPENLPGVKAGAEEDKEKERADAEVRQLPDHVLLQKKQRTEKSIKSGFARRLPDGGRKLRASLDAVLRELSRRNLLSEAGAKEDKENERAEDDEEKERGADAEARQEPGHALREKKLPDENAIKAGLAGRLPDGGKRPRATLDTPGRELVRRKLLSEAPHPSAAAGGGPGARAEDEKGCQIFVPSRCPESSGMGPHAQMLMAVVPTESLFSGEVGAEEQDKEKERADDEVRQLPDHAPRKKKLRTKKLIKAELTDCLPDGGKKLCKSPDAICPELTQRKPRSEAPLPHGCSGGGDTAPVAQAQDEKGRERIVQPRCAKSSGTGPRAYISRRVMLCSVLKAIKGSEASFRSVGCGVPDRFAVEVYAEAPWPGITGNVRHLKAMSDLCDSVEAAEESAANNLVIILQQEYGVIVDDFNYAALCMEREKKKAKTKSVAAKGFKSG
ncbi:hypothetical protein EJB05_44855, partial [Eragrostis curvula]